MEVYRIHGETAVYFLTFTVIEWLPVFVATEPCQIVTESLNFCHQSKSLRINAYVVMPTHVHLIGFDADFDVARLQHTLRDMRQYTGRRLADYCEQHMPGAFNQVIHNTRSSDRRRQFWQQSKHPVAIWTEPFWRTKFDYIHDNPRRKGLVREGTAWRFSSATYWLSDTQGGSDVILTGIEW